MNIVKRIYKDVVNYRYIIKTLKEQEVGPTWKALNLRRDWVGRVYTIINIDDELIKQMSPLEITGYILDHSQPFNSYLTTLDFQEIVSPDFRRIKGTNSWLVVYTPLFRGLTSSFFMWLFGLLIAGGALLRYWDKIASLAGWSS